MTFEEIIQTPEWTKFVDRHYNKHRYIEGVSLYQNRITKEVSRVLYDGYIFDVKKELGDQDERT